MFLSPVLLTVPLLDCEASSVASFFCNLGTVDPPGHLVRGTWGKSGKLVALAPELLLRLLPDEEIHGASGASASQLFFHFQVRPVARNTLNHPNLVRILQLLLPSL